MKVLFIFNEFSLHNHIIEHYLEARPADEVAIVKIPLVLKGKSRKETAGRILPQLSKRFVWNKLQEAAVTTAIALIPKILKRGAIFRRLRLIAWRNGLPFHQSGDIMSPVTLDFIRNFEPAVIVTLVHQIIKPDLIAIPPHGVINIHPGILPEFRGIQPYFWELSEKFGEAGVTLHYIDDATVDTGRIVAQSRYPTLPGMSVQLNYFLTARCAGALLPETISRLEAGELRPKPQKAEEGSYYRWPDKAAVDRLYGAGHQIVSWTELARILTGRYDHFKAADVKIFD